MAKKTIPQLDETTTITASAVMPVDSGIQTYRISALNLARQLKKLVPTTSEVVTYSKTWTAPAGVSLVTVYPSTDENYWFNTSNTSTPSVIGIGDDGTAYGWGSNTNGELGVGDVLAKSIPTLVSGGLKFKKIAYGNSACFGLTGDNVVYSWGLNANGQLGLGDVIPRSTPTLVLGGVKFRKVITGSLFSMGLSVDGTVYTWGVNISGQLGQGDIIARSSPVLVTMPKKIKQIGIGTANCIALATDGDLYSWGLNSNGQLGLNDTIPRSTPTLVTSGFKYEFVVGGLNNFVMAKGLSDGQLYSWGSNTPGGQLGLGDTINRSSPIVVTGMTNVKKLTCGGPVTFAQKFDGTWWAWGRNVEGCLGLGDSVNRSTPTLVSGTANYQKIVAGYASFAITTSGQMYSWGYNLAGQLGVGDVINRSTPTVVSTPSFVSWSNYVPRQPVVIPVTAGQSYDIVLGQKTATFGNNVIGTDLDDFGGITLVYESS